MTQVVVWASPFVMPTPAWYMLQVTNYLTWFWVKSPYGRWAIASV